MKKLLWQHIIVWDHSSTMTGDVGTESNTIGVQLHFAPMMPAQPAAKRFAEHIYLCEVSISLESCTEQAGRLQ